MTRGSSAFPPRWLLTTAAPTQALASPSSHALPRRALTAPRLLSGTPSPAANLRARPMHPVAVLHQGKTAAGFVCRAGSAVSLAGGAPLDVRQLASAAASKYEMASNLSRITCLSIPPWNALLGISRAPYAR